MLIRVTHGCEQDSHIQQQLSYYDTAGVGWEQEWKDVSHPFLLSSTRQQLSKSEKDQQVALLQDICRDVTELMKERKKVDVQCRKEITAIADLKHNYEKVV